MKPLALWVLARVFPLLGAVRTVYRRIRKPITVGVRALITDGEQVVLMRTHGSAVWDLPGGGVKHGETLRAAAIREACEETGCHVEVNGVLGMYLSMHNGHSDHVVVFVCCAQTTPNVALNLEIAQARTWPIKSLPPSVPPATRRRIAEYLAGKRNIEALW